MAVHPHGVLSLGHYLVISVCLAHLGVSANRWPEGPRTYKGNTGSRFKGFFGDYV